MRIIATILFLTLQFTTQGQDKKYTFVFLNKKPNAEKLSEEDSEKIMSGHMANINRLAAEGKLVAAGPFEGGGGIFILNSTKVEEAREWLSTDPGIQANRWDVEMYPYTPRFGSVCKVSEPYEMVMYSFVRFDAIVSKYTASTYPQILKKHDDYVKRLSETGNVITEGVFGEHDGGIVVMKGDVQKEIFEADPGVQEGLMEITLKKLYIAKGSFCEK